LSRIREEGGDKKTEGGACVAGRGGEGKSG